MGTRVRKVPFQSILSSSQSIESLDGFIFRLVLLFRRGSDSSSFLRRFHLTKQRLRFAPTKYRVVSIPVGILAVGNRKIETHFMNCLLLYALSFAVHGDMMVSDGEMYFGFDLKCPSTSAASHTCIGEPRKQSSKTHLSSSNLDCSTWRWYSMLLDLSSPSFPIDSPRVGLMSLLLVGEEVLTSRLARGLEGEGVDVDIVVDLDSWLGVVGIDQFQECS